MVIRHFIVYFIFVSITLILNNVASNIYEKELDLYIYFNEVKNGNYLSTNWVFDLGFSAFLILLSPLIISPGMLSVSVFITIFLISINLFKKKDSHVKAVIFCASFPIFIGCVNQIRATLFMVIFLYAMNSNSYKKIKFIIASMFHYASFLLWLPFVLSQIKKTWKILLLIILILIAYLNQEIITLFLNQWQSYSFIDTDLTTIVLKLLIVLILSIYIPNKIYKIILIFSILFIITFENYGLLDRYLTLAMIFVNFFFLNSIENTKFKLIKYFMFTLINTILIINSSLFTL